MIVDCSTCVVRGRGCDGCVVTVLFGGVPGADVPWHAPGRAEADPPARRVEDDVDRAIGVLAAAGMLGPDWVSVGLVPTTLRSVESDHRHAV